MEVYLPLKSGSIILFILTFQLPPFESSLNSPRPNSIMSDESYFIACHVPSVGSLVIGQLKGPL